jgi:hypothetical protein
VITHRPTIRRYAAQSLTGRSENVDPGGRLDDKDRRIAWADATRVRWEPPGAGRNRRVIDTGRALLQENLDNRRLVR